MKRQILLVEDEPALAMTVSDRLEDEGYGVDTVVDGYSAERLALTGRFDVIVLDIMLPGQDGFAVCRRLRQQGIMTPVLMLTALSEVEDRVRGLQLGADDYLGKPFAMKELVARVEALVRRVPVARKTVSFGVAKVDFSAHTASCAGEPVELSRRLFQLLEWLVEHAGTTVTREALLASVWGQKAATETRTVDVHIAALRRALEIDPQHPRHIITVRGQGYRFEPDQSGVSSELITNS